MQPAANFFKNRILTTLIVILVFCNNHHAVAQDIAEKDIPSEVQKAFSKKFTEHSDAYWMMKDGNYIVSFKTGMQYLDACFSVKGKWLSTERIIEFSALPKAVADSLHASQFGTWDVGNTYVVEIPGKPARYRLYVYSSTWDELELNYEANGELIVDKP
jgi:hypothetical protein